MANLYDVLGNIWMPRLFRNLNDWEVGELCRLLSLLDGLKPDPTSWMVGCGLSLGKANFLLGLFIWSWSIIGLSHSSQRHLDPRYPFKSFILCVEYFSG